MSETTYKEQTKRFDEAAAALVRADIDLIRCSKDLRAFERKRKIAAIVRDDLSGRGRFIRTRDDEIFFSTVRQDSLPAWTTTSFALPFITASG
jgi:hypothetical protein